MFELSIIKQFIISFFSPEVLAMIVSLGLGLLVSIFLLRFFSDRSNATLFNLSKARKSLLKIKNFKWKEVFQTEPWPTLKFDQPTKLEYFWGWLYLPLRISYFKQLKIFLSFLFLVTVLIALINDQSSYLLLLILIIFLATIFLWHRFHKARRKFIDQIPDGLMRLIEALQSGYSLPQAITFLSGKLQTPLKDIFSFLDRALELGLPLEEAMLKTEEQININEWSMIIKGLTVQFKMGGNIIPFLEEIVVMQREKLALQREIQTLTASSRTTGYLLAGLVPVIMIILSLISPDYFSVFFQTSIGQNLFILAIILEIIGFLWIYKILKISY